jgi:hypothetical protein
VGAGGLLPGLGNGSSRNSKLVSGLHVEYQVIVEHTYAPKNVCLCHRSMGIHVSQDRKNICT